MNGEASDTPRARPPDLNRLEEMQARIADLEAKLAEANRVIVNALDSSVSLEDMCKKLRAAHATLKEALRNRTTRAA